MIVKLSLKVAMTCDRQDGGGFKSNPNNIVPSNL